ncbi:unnamed protein product, partial [Ixodes pacificus]
MRVTLAERNVCSVNTNGLGHCIMSSSCEESPKIPLGLCPTLSPSSPPKSSQARRIPSSPEFRSLSKGNCHRVSCRLFSCSWKPSS